MDEVWILGQPYWRSQSDYSAISGRAVWSLNQQPISAGSMLWHLNFALPRETSRRCRSNDKVLYC